MIKSFTVIGSRNQLKRLGDFMTKERIKELVKLNPSITIEINKMVEAVAKRFDVTKKEIYSHRRTERIAFPRQVSQYLAMEKTDMTIQAIADCFGMHHSTLIHSRRRVIDAMSVEPDKKLKVDLIRKELNQP